MKPFLFFFVGMYNMEILSIRFWTLYLVKKLFRIKELIKSKFMIFLYRNKFCEFKRKFNFFLCESCIINSFSNSKIIKEKLYTLYFSTQMDV